MSAVYVFGSVARQEDGPDSDVDIAIQVSDGAPFGGWDLSWVASAFGDALETKVDVVELECMSDKMKQQIDRDLKIVFQSKDRSFSSEFTGDTHGHK